MGLESSRGLGQRFVGGEGTPSLALQGEDGRERKVLIATFLRPRKMNKSFRVSLFGDALCAL